MRAQAAPAAPAQEAGEQPLPLLVRDIAADLSTTPIQVCKALADLGFGGHSVNMVVTPQMAKSLRAHFAATAQAAPAAVAGPAQCPTSVDAKTMELAESVGLIGPASRTHDLHAAIQRFHDLVCVNATIKAAQMASEAIREASPVAQGDAEDAARYRWLRRGQRWSVIDGIGDTLCGDELDAAIDAARSHAKEGQSHE